MTRSEVDRQVTIATASTGDIGTLRKSVPRDTGNVLLPRKVYDTHSAKESAVTALVDTLIHATRTHDPSEGCEDAIADEQDSRVVRSDAKHRVGTVSHKASGEHLGRLVMPRKVHTERKR